MALRRNSEIVRVAIYTRVSTRTQAEKHGTAG